MLSTPKRPEGPTPGRSRSFVILRTVPGDSPLHRLWAGTKLMAVAAISVSLSLKPSWAALAVAAAVVLTAMLIGRIPTGAIPRPPRWFWLLLGIGAVLTLRAGSSPYVHLAGARIGLGGVDTYARFTVLAFVLLLAAALVGWTTPIGDIAPALARLCTPLRWLRLPVDEWAVTTGLCVRCFPLIAGEFRTLAAARRLRPREPAAAPSARWRRGLSEASDLLGAALAASLRRAGELGRAIEARGGVRLTPTPVSVGPADLLALLVAGAATAAVFLLPG